MNKKSFGKRLIGGMAEGLAVMKKGEPLPAVGIQVKQKRQSSKSRNSVKTINPDFTEEPNRNGTTSAGINALDGKKER